MKNLFNLTLCLIMSTIVFAQSPQEMSYQAIIRNSSGQLVNNQAVGMKISILQGSVTGTTVYSETHTPTIDGNGMATVEIGSGNIITGTFTRNGNPFTISWTNLTGTPTTLEGYRITNAVTNTLDINFINSLKKGDMVLTTGGLYGRIFEVQENFVKLEVEDVVLSVYKNAIRKPPGY